MHRIKMAHPPAMEQRLVVTVEAAEASLDAMAMPTSAAAIAAKSLMPSPQYMQVLFRPCTALNCS